MATHKTTNKGLVSKFWARLWILDILVKVDRISYYVQMIVTGVLNLYNHLSSSET